MFAFGSIVLARFPFTDLTGDKRRPALVVSRENDRRSDLVVCFITSVPRAGPDMVAITPSPVPGLKFRRLCVLTRSRRWIDRLSPASLVTPRPSG